MGDIFWTVFGLALALCAAPGPVAVETVRRGVQHGYWPALGVQLGAVAAELGWAAVVALGLAPLVQQPAVQPLLTLLGTAFLLWTAWQSLRAARLPVALELHRASTRSATLVGALYAASNPLTVLFWLSVVALLAGRSGGMLPPAQWLVVGAAYALGGLAWGALLALLAALGHRHVRPNTWRG